MKMNSVGMVCVMCAGSVGSVAIGGEGSPTKLEPSRGRVVDVAHIYYNIMSGERVVTLLGDGEVVGADNGISAPVWSARVANPCEAQGFSTEFFYGLDDNSETSALSTNASLHDWGDVPTDTVVDCVHIDWVTDHDDVDGDGDGLGDGVIGLSAQWTFWDADNGRVNCIREPLIQFIFTDLPGDTSGTTDPDDPNNTLAGYSADVDLAAQFSSSLVFEIGDSDGDLQGAAFGSTNVDTDSDGIGDGVSIAAPGVDRNFDGLDDADLDGDGLFDWAWSVRFRQPGTADLDGDGVNEGDLADSFKTIGVSFGVPSGEAIDNGNGTWTWELATSGEGVGLGSEDAFSIFNEHGDHAGTFWFGGFSCEDNGSGGYTPSANFEMALYGPACFCEPFNCDAADLAEPFNQHNFFDVSAFLGAYNAEDDAADIAEPFGTWNFFDVSAFLGEYNDGCP